MTPQEGHSKSAAVIAEDGQPLVNGLENSASTEKNEKFYNESGMHWLVTALFIVGETAGGGLIALPSAMVSAGLFWGTLIMILGAVICSYTGIQLADNWTILQKRWPEYRSHCRKPYPAMGERALGKRFSYFVSFLLDVTQFGTAVVFLLLAAKNIETFLSIAGIQINFCCLIVVVALFMLPVTMLKSPKDFWWAVIMAMFTTAAAVTLIIYGAAKDATVCMAHGNYPGLNVNKVAMCFGTVMFAYGGHGAFPTIQHDMKKPSQFKKAVILAFAIITVMYLPVSITGYVAYGDSLLDTIIPSLQTTEVRFAVNMLITLHVILALTIVFNPLNQELEDYAEISQDFGWQRVLVRSLVMAAVVLVGVSVPSFGVLLDLVGGSTITTMALIFPVLFNLYLKAGANKHKNETANEKERPLTVSEMISYSSRLDLVINVFILVVGVLGGIMATGTALKAMFASEYSMPCWWGVIAELPVEPSIQAISSAVPINCCGAFKNISIFPDEVCMDVTQYVSSGSHG